MSNALRSSVPLCWTHHIDGVDVGKLREELTTAEGQLGVGLQKLLSGETKPDTRMTQWRSERETKASVKSGQTQGVVRQWKD